MLPGNYTEILLLYVILPAQFKVLLLHVLMRDAGGFISDRSAILFCLGSKDNQD